MPSEPTFFRVCSTCRKEIGFEQGWYRCSVTTCNRGRTALFFCSVECWSAHVPVVRHRDAWAEQEKAPTRQAWMSQLEAERGSAREGRERGGDDDEGAEESVRDEGSEAAGEVLVVVSKLKGYIRGRSGFSTSDGVAEVLSDHLRELCKEAIRSAGRDGRKTVMARDFGGLVRKG